MTRNHWTLWLDDLRPAWLAGAFVFLLIVPALFYYMASQYSPANGLHSPEISVGHQQGITPADAIYFSVVTQATLGYGDFRPQGWSRVVASMQVLLGLVLAGIVVGKITSAPRTKFHRHARMACGVWTDIVITNSLIAMGVIRIYERDGSLEIDGWNYDQKARSLGTWHSTLVNDRWPTLVFEYTNQYGDMSDFTHGYNSITFYVDDNAKWAQTKSFQAKAVDALKGAFPPFEGTRVTDPDTLRRLAEGGDERRKAVELLLRDRLVPNLEPDFEQPGR